MKGKDILIYNDEDLKTLISGSLAFLATDREIECYSDCLFYADYIIKDIKLGREKVQVNNNTTEAIKIKIKNFLQDRYGLFGEIVKFDKLADELVEAINER